MALVAIVKSVRACDGGTEYTHLSYSCKQWFLFAKHPSCAIHNMNVCINNAFLVHCLLMTSNLKRLMAKYAHFISYIFIMQCNEAAIFSRNFKFYFRFLGVCACVGSTTFALCITTCDIRAIFSPSFHNSGGILLLFVKCEHLNTTFVSFLVSFCSAASFVHE